MGFIWQDMVWALRTLRRNLGVTLVVALSLGLAIGANTAIFSVVNAFLLRPLAVREIERMVRVREMFGGPGQEPEIRNVTALTYSLWKEHNEVFENMAAATEINLNLTGQGEAERLSGTRITANFLDVLGVQPILGRNIRPEEDQPGRGRVALISHGLWTRRFGGERDILGKVLIFNEEPYTVIGVLPRGFHHPYGSDVWVPAALVADPAAPFWTLYVPARLRPGMTREHAEAEMARLSERLAREQPFPDAPNGAQLTPLRDELIQGIDKKLLLLFMAAGFVLLIACANVSNLLIAQSLSHESEVAVRVALGATRRRLVRQFLVYSVLLSLLGGLCGLLFSFWGLKPLVALTSLQALGEFDVEPRMDLTTLGFTLLISLLAGVAFGLTPSLRVSRASLSNSLKEGGRTRTIGSRGMRVLNSLVVSEIALAVVLLMGSGLMIQSFQRLRSLDRGFDPRNLLLFEVGFSATTYPEEHQRIDFIRRATDRLRALPQATAAGATTTEPMYVGQNYLAYNVEGQPATNTQGVYIAHHRTITPGYMETLQVPLLQGRSFTTQDSPVSQHVVIVSKSLADRYWPDQNPLGKRIKRGRYDSERPWLTVVGVVGNVRETENPNNTEVGSDAVYLPYSQTNLPAINSIVFALRTAAAPELAIQDVRSALRSIDSNQPIFDVSTMEYRVGERTRQDKLSATLYAIFGVLGLVLAAVGVYGLLSFIVHQRQREIGIRAAMGAQPSELRRLIFRRALILTVTGLTLGALGASLLTRFLASQLYEIDPRDPVTLMVAVVGLAGIALISGYIPARRAARVDPVQALRQ